MKLVLSLCLLIFLWSGPAFAQETNLSTTPERPIQDNSFLLEEAYNQEAGVVQHISSFTRLWNSKSWTYNFTQEWPVPNHERHQLSYSLTTLKAGEGQDPGFGDLLLHYRYQLVGDGDARLAFAPRISLIVPSGSAKKATGYGGTGMQSGLPASIVLNKYLVGHLNLGGTWVPSAHDAAGDRAASYGYTAGGSLIWLAHSRFNLMLENTWSSAHLVSRPHGTDVVNTLWLAPGARWAYNFKNGLQIVPGVSFIAGVGPSSADRGAFFYLSFEHPMWKDRKK